MKYKESGIQTKITPLVIKEANKLNGRGLHLLVNIVNYIHKNYKVSKSKKFHTEQGQLTR